VGVTIDRTGNIAGYGDGTADGTPASTATVGKVVTSSARGLNVGVNGNTTLANYFSGSIGPVMVVRFNSLPSDIANQIAYISATWRKKGFPKVIGDGMTRLYIDWQNPSDKSGNSNNITPAGGAGITRLR
jgi:hypothetical protein